MIGTSRFVFARRGFGLMTAALVATTVLGGPVASASSIDGGAIAYEFTGRIIHGDPGSGASLGDSFTGRLSWNSSLANSGVTLPGSPTIYDGPVELSITVGSKTYAFDVPAASFISIQHGSTTPDGLGGGDQFLAGVFGTKTAANGLADFMALSLYDPSGTAFGSQALPTTLDLGRFSSSTVGGIFDGHTIAGTIVSFQPVPEPSALAVLGLGAIGGLAWHRRRSRRAA